MNVRGATEGSSNSNVSNPGATGVGGASMDSTFMTLLVTELKAQDPTAPMDATQMVGQMVSLNQLDQLIQIHQLLSENPAIDSTGQNSGSTK